MQNSIKKDNYFNLTNWFFIIAILIFSITSLFHVTVFWLITNSLFLAVIMSIATGVGIISSLLSTKYTKLTYISFALIILIELFGNIYGAFIHIDINSQYFKGWKELMEPIFSFFYTTDEGVPIADAIYKRWAAIIQGSFIPLLLSITFHMWMVVRDKYHSIKKPSEPEQIESWGDVKNDVKNDAENDAIHYNEKEGDFELSLYEAEYKPIKNTFKEPKIFEDTVEPELLKEVKYPSGDTIVESLEKNITKEPIFFSGSTVEQFETMIDSLTNEEIIERLEEAGYEVEKEEIPEEIIVTAPVEMKVPIPKKGRTIDVKNSDIGKIFLKPEND